MKTKATNLEDQPKPEPKYVLVIDAYADSFARAVNEKIEEGYRPLGSPVVFEQTLVQALFKQS